MKDFKRQAHILFPKDPSGCHVKTRLEVQTGPNQVRIPPAPCGATPWVPKAKEKWSSLP